jgi:hypothetical protein
MFRSWRIEDMHYWVMKLSLQADQGRSEPLSCIPVQETGWYPCMLDASSYVHLFVARGLMLLHLLRLDLGVGLYGDVLVGLQGVDLVLGELGTGTEC